VFMFVSPPWGAASTWCWRRRRWAATSSQSRPPAAQPRWPGARWPSRAGA